MRHERLKNDVMHLGLEAFEGQGEPMDVEWAPEQSHLVIGLSADEARAIGRRHGQIAIVVGEMGRRARLLRCDIDA